MSKTITTETARDMILVTDTAPEGTKSQTLRFPLSRLSITHNYSRSRFATRSPVTRSPKSRSPRHRVRTSGMPSPLRFR